MPEIDLKEKYMVFLLKARVDLYKLIKDLKKFKKGRTNAMWSDLKGLLESCEI